MSFERNRSGFGEIRFECDECDTELHTEITSFPDALAFIKRDGWTVVKDADVGWMHLCPSCVEDET